MDESKWIRVDPEEFERQAIGRKGRGIEFTVFVSPYDVPEAIRGRYDERKKRFLIEFKYIQNEPWRLQPQDDHVALRLGENSGRLQGIEVDVVALKAAHIKLDLINRVERTIERAASGHGIAAAQKRIPEDNYHIALDVIETKKDEIFAGLEPAY
ncbi:MAG: hypothetical protein ACT4O1_10305 [Gemmatimonadota bacterium]